MMKYKITKTIDNRKITIPYSNNMVNDDVIIEDQGEVNKIYVVNDRLCTSNSIDGYKFYDEMLEYLDSLFEGYKKDKIICYYFKNKIIKFDYSTFQVSESKIEYPKDGEYKDPVRTLRFKDGKLVYLEQDDCKVNFGTYQGIVNYHGKSYASYNGCVYQLKKRFTYDENYLLVIDHEEYPSYGPFNDPDRLIHFYDGKVSMKERNQYSFQQRIDDRYYYFEVDDNMIKKIYVDYNWDNPHEVIDNYCPDLDCYFVLDTYNWTISKKDHLIEYPTDGIYEDEKKKLEFSGGRIKSIEQDGFRINFMNGKMYSVYHNNRTYLLDSDYTACLKKQFSYDKEYNLIFKDVIKQDGYMIYLENNKISKVKLNDREELYPIQHDGYSIFLKKYFILDHDKVIIKDKLKMNKITKGNELGMTKGNELVVISERNSTNNKPVIKQVYELLGNKKIVYSIDNNLVVKKEYFVDGKLYKTVIIN